MSASRLIDRAEGFALLALGLAAGIALPHPVTTALWTAAAQAFERSGDVEMVERLVSSTKFGSRIEAGRRGNTLGHPRFA